jgi:Fe/S biogenesis protein NfuA
MANDDQAKPTEDEENPDGAHASSESALMGQSTVQPEVTLDADEIDTFLKSITVTESAQSYLLELLDKQDKPKMGVRIFIEKPGTPHAECCMAYCGEDEQEEDDLELPLSGFSAWIELRSVVFLENAVVDYNKDRMGGQLTFKAPKSKLPQLGANATVTDRINHVLYSEINPGLAAHGGYVSLLNFDEEEGVVVLQFGGGCQGCSAVDMTLKQGVEKTLMEQIPEVKLVSDSTDHSVKDNAYY